jgi:hypothetical protein
MNLGEIDKAIRSKIQNGLYGKDELLSLLDQVRESFLLKKDEMESVKKSASEALVIIREGIQCGDINDSDVIHSSVVTMGNSTLVMEFANSFAEPLLVDYVDVPMHMDGFSRYSANFRLERGW